MIMEDYYLIGESTGKDADTVRAFLKEQELWSKTHEGGLYVWSNYDDVLDIAKLLYEETGIKMLDPAVTGRLSYNQLHNKVIDTHTENLTRVFLSENAEKKADEINSIKQP